MQCNLDGIIGALLNLINNSIQATTHADISIRFTTENQYLQIDILDNGPGIDAAAQDHVGELFFTTKEQGTGIGLSVVTIVAQSHGGTFTISNRPEGGACARLSLPISQNINQSMTSVVIYED